MSKERANGSIRTALIKKALFLLPINAVIVYLLFYIFEFTLILPFPVYRITTAVMAIIICPALVFLISKKRKETHIWFYPLSHTLFFIIQASVLVWSTGDANAVVFRWFFPFILRTFFCYGVPALIVSVLYKTYYQKQVPIVEPVESDDVNGTDKKIKYRKEISVKKRVVISSVIALMLWYPYRILSSDLLTAWEQYGFMTIGDSTRHYLINSKNGAKTYIPFFALPILDYTHPKSAKELTDRNEEMTLCMRIHDIHPYTNNIYSVRLVGYYDEDTIIFTTKFFDNQWIYDLNRYIISTNQYELLMRSNVDYAFITGNSKIFAFGIIFDFDGKRQDNIYRYFPDTDELHYIKTYRTKRNIKLIAVLK